MAKWVLETFQGTKVWYSEDVVEKLHAALTKILEISCNETKIWVRNPPIETIANIAGEALAESEE